MAYTDDLSSSIISNRVDKSIRIECNFYEVPKEIPTTRWISTGYASARYHGYD